MLGSVLDSVLALKSATSQEACDFILLYILLIGILVNTAFQYKLWVNILLILVQAFAIELLCHYLDVGDFQPSVKQ